MAGPSQRAIRKTRTYPCSRRTDWRDTTTIQARPAAGIRLPAL